MSEQAGQTPYEFARAFFSFLEALAVVNVDYSGHWASDLRRSKSGPGTTGGHPRAYCGLCADSGTPRHRCIGCAEPIPNGTAHIRSRLFVQVALCGLCAGRAAKAS